MLVELVERQVEKVLSPFLAALESDDLDLAMRGGRELMDRAWGKPRQAVDQTIEAGDSLAALLAPRPLESTDTKLGEGTD